MATTRFPQRTRSRLVGGLAPGACAAGILIAGVLIGKADHWGTGAYWTLGLGSGLVAAFGYTLPGLLRAPKREKATMVDLDGDEAQLPDKEAQLPDKFSLGMPVEAQSDHAELSPSRVIVLSGHTASRKTEMAQRLHEQHPEWAWASCGSFVKAEASRRGISTSDRAETDQLGQRLVEELGGSGFLDAVLEHAALPPHPETLLIEDVYHAEVFEAINERWGHMRFVSVEIPESMRQRDARPSGEIRESTLDRELRTLLDEHQPERTIPAAEDENQVAERTEELELALS
jgi:hypothetical protein